MPIKFHPVLPYTGFDDTASPEWLLIPLKEQIPIWLEDGAGLEIISSSPIIDIQNTPLTVSGNPNWRCLSIKGKSPGNCFILLRKNGAIVKKLEIAVKRKITITISFHYVFDNANHHTDRNPKDLPEIMFWLNQIVEPQTNIRFEVQNTFKLLINKNMGETVNFNMDYQGRIMKGHEFDLVTSRRDKSANVNVFFVWKNEFISKDQRGKLTKSGALGYSVGGRDILVEDWNGLIDRDEDGESDNAFSPVWENARMLAHEIGHVLGIADIVKRKKLFNPITRDSEYKVVNRHYVMGSGPFIPKNHSNIMYNIARQIAGR